MSTHKSNMDEESFTALHAAAAAADGAPRRPASLGGFRAATAESVAASQNTQLPAMPEVAPSARAPSAAATSASAANPPEEKAPKEAAPLTAVGVEFEVDLSRLHVLPENSRFDYTEQEVDDMLAAFLREGKQLKAMELTPHETIPGDYYVLDGETRKRGLIKWGKTTGRAVVVNVVGAWERYKASWYANNGSRHTTDYDNGMRWRDMIDRGETSQPMISVALGEKYSQSTVSRVLAISKFPESCRNFIRDNKRKLSSGFYYSAYSLMKELEGDERKEQQILDVLTMAVEEDLSARVFEERIEKIAKGRETSGDPAANASTKKSVAPQPLLLAGREVGAIKEWSGQDRLDISMKRVPAELRDKIKEAVQKVFADAALAAGEATR